MRNLANKIEEFSKCDDFSGEISSAHRYVITHPLGRIIRYYLEKSTNGKRHQDHAPEKDYHYYKMEGDFFKCCDFLDARGRAEGRRVDLRKENEVTG
jgi:hypothetical protein